MNTNPTLDWIPNTLAAFAFLGAVTFVVIYASFANWRLTAPGRALMYWVASFALLILMNTIHLATGRYTGIEFVRIIVYGFLATSVWRLVATLVHILRGQEPITLQTITDPMQRRHHKETTTLRVDKETAMPKHAALTQTDTHPVAPGTPTQVANPGRAVARTAFAYIIGALVALPTINLALAAVQDELLNSGLDIPAWIWAALNGAIVVGGLVMALITRLLAVPGINEWVKQHIPALAAIPVKAAEKGE